MTVARRLFTATRLTDGKILVAGGTIGGGCLITAELYDPATEQFTSVGDMTMERLNHAAVLLSDGRVLLAGGRLPPMSVEDPDILLASAELYDPGTRTFTATGDMTTARGKPLAVLLKNDKVLVVGGQVGKRDRSGAELYDPISGKFSTVDGLARFHDAATNLDDGKVLLFGNSGPAEIYDAQTGSFSDAGSMSAGRTDFSATLLVNGGVLIAGGRGALGSGSPELSTAEIFMPTSDAFIPIGPMNVARSQHTATRLADNRVLVCGGSGDDRAEIYDPASGSFALAGKMVAIRGGHSAIALANGKVLILGGQALSSPNTELFEP